MNECTGVQLDPRQAGPSAVLLFAAWMTTHWRLASAATRSHRVGIREQKLSFIDFRTPAAGFDQPLELWLACHDRVRRMTSLLERLHEHLQLHGADESARVTATSICRYFDEAAPRHHEDEEVDLFPLLRRLLPVRAPEQEAAVTAALRRLESDHVELGRLWRQAREILKAIESGQPALPEPELVKRFVAGYRQHCELEDTVIAGALQRCLGDADLDAIGEAMAERRGVDWTHLHSSRNGRK
jgi:hemerythrin-like domain-containing protein